MEEVFFLSVLLIKIKFQFDLLEYFFCKILHTLYARGIRLPFPSFYSLWYLCMYAYKLQ